MSSASETSANLIGGAVWLLLFCLYVVGIFVLVTDDHRYTTKNLVAGVILFPYAWYVGGKTIYHYATNSSEHRAIENKCMDYAEAQEVGRKARVWLCDCVANGTSVQQCNVLYEKKLGG